MRSTGVAILGAGFMSRTYAEIITRQLENTCLKGIACGSRAPQLAADYGVPCYEAMETLLDEPDVDLVIIATPHAQHFSMARAALIRGKHVVLEKPMTTRLDEADELIRLAGEQHVLLTIMFGQRYRICNQETRRILLTGELGRLRHIESFHLVPGGIAAVPKWQLDPENIGILLGHGIHNFDQLRWFSGSEIACVTASCGQLDPACPIEATSNVLIEMENGVSATIHCSFEFPSPGFPRTQFGAQLVCEQGLIDLDAYGELRVSSGGKPWVVRATQPAVDWHGKGFLDPVRLESYTRLISEFVDAMESGNEPPISGWDGRQALAGALAAYEASASGRKVELNSSNVKAGHA